MEELNQLIQDLNSAPIKTDDITNTRYRQTQGLVGPVTVTLIDLLDTGGRVYIFVSDGEIFYTENPKTALAFLKEHVS